MSEVPIGNTITPKSSAWYFSRKNWSILRASAICPTKVSRRGHAVHEHSILPYLCSTFQKSRHPRSRLTFLHTYGRPSYDLRKGRWFPDSKRWGRNDLILRKATENLNILVE